MSVLDWLIFLVPFTFVLHLAWRSRKYVKGVADFLAAGRVCGRYVISVADVAGGLAVVTLVAAVEGAYQTGYSVAFWGSILAPLSIVMSLTGFCAYRFRETRSMSLGQFLEMRYNRSFRIFAAGLRTFSETICNMIVPAVSARFFICLIGLPYHVDVFGVKISTFALIIISVLILALFIIWCGGTVALVITDAFQAILSYPIFAVLVFYVLSHLSFFDQIGPVMADRVAGQSFINPYDVESLRDFNLFALVVTFTSNILNRASWIGAGNTAAGRTPHEQKMAGILGAWRQGFSTMFYVLMGALIITVLSHVDFAPKAKEIRSYLVANVAGQVFSDDKLKEEYLEISKNIPPHNHRIGVDAPLSNTKNLDSPYLDSALEVLRKGENGNAKFQEFRTLYFQQMLPVSIRHILPVGLIGLFALLMIMLMVSTDDSRIFSGALTLVQDVVLPIYNKPISPKTHILLLRLSALFIGICFFCGSFFMAQLDYINLFSVITTSIWMGGAGPVMIGGLYSRFGNTWGAFASLLSGTIISGGGILVQRNWADHLYPLIERLGWVDEFTWFFDTFSGPFQPYIVWEMNPIKFPINSQELFFIAMMSGIASYVLVSLITGRGKEKFNLDQMLHRGIYSESGCAEVKEKITFRAIFAKFIGIDSNYTRGDKIIAWSVFVYSFVYSFLIMFLLVVISNAIMPWNIKAWEVYFFICYLLVPGIIAVISTFWFMIGGTIDMRRLFRDLDARVDNPLDDGRVQGNVSLADARKAETAEAQQK